MVFTQLWKCEVIIIIDTTIQRITKFTINNNKQCFREELHTRAPRKTCTGNDIELLNRWVPVSRRGRNRSCTSVGHNRVFKIIEISWFWSFSSPHSKWLKWWTVSFNLHIPRQENHKKLGAYGTCKWPTNIAHNELEHGTIYFSSLEVSARAHRWSDRFALKIRIPFMTLFFSLPWNDRSGSEDERKNWNAMKMMRRQLCGCAEHVNQIYLLWSRKPYRHRLLNDVDVYFACGTATHRLSDALRCARDTKWKGRQTACFFLSYFSFLRFVRFLLLSLWTTSSHWHSHTCSLLHSYTVVLMYALHT